MFTVVTEDLADGCNVAGTSNEGGEDHVDIVLDPPLQIGDIFG